MDEESVSARFTFEESFEEKADQHNPTPRWSLDYLRNQFVLFEELYKKYIRRLQYGYFSLFLILQFLLSTSYSLVIYFENYDHVLEDITPDIYCYGITAVIPLIAIFFIEETKIVIASFVAYVGIYALDTFLPLYHYLQHDENMRTPFTTHLIIACYIFFAFEEMMTAIITGAIVTVTHLTICGTITFRDFETGALMRKLAIELLYFGCINAMGCYFRYMNEIMNRRSFLVKKDQTIEKIQLKGQQEQQRNLLEAILPLALYEKEPNDPKKTKLSFLQEHMNGTITKPFENMKKIIKPHKNVTILYADIVNYTAMTTQITPASQFVQVLDDLFGGFDEDSEKLHVMRIKFLGDCYYCVSGLEPERNSDHANACVQLGLKMIKRIKVVAKGYNIDLNMRIGIHTGNIYSTLIGRTKWQFEIWSKDVELANTMESTGFTGKIHITQATMDELMRRKALVALDPSLGTAGPMKHIEKKDSTDSTDSTDVYFVYKTNAIEFHKKLASSTTMTYVITPEEMTDVTDVYDCAIAYDIKSTCTSSRSSRIKSSRFNKNVSIDTRPLIEEQNTKKPKKEPRKDSERRSGQVTSMEEFSKYEETTDDTIKEEIKKMPLTKYQQWFKEEQINPLFLVFKNCQTERSYILQDDPLYKYYIVSVLLVLLCFIVIRFLALPEWHYTTLLSIFTALALSLLAPILLLPRRTHHGPINEEADNLEIGDTLPRTYYKISNVFAKSTLLRITVYGVLSAIFIACFVIELIHCDYHNFKLLEDPHRTITMEENEKCLQPWNITEIINLILIMSFLFLNIHMWIKFLYGTIVTAMYCLWIWIYAYDYFNNEPSFHYMMQPPVAHIINIIFLTTTLHCIDRQADYLNRLDYKWHLQLIQDKASSVEARKEILHLLENVMPYDVARKYLKRKGDKNRQKLYYERYETVAVMFATVIDSNPLPDDEEKLYMVIMNQIISDFDRILLSDKYKGKIEKIKLANLKTYVACSGLAPGKKLWTEKSEEAAEFGVRSRKRMASDTNLIDLADFAADILKSVKEHNKEMARNYSLRIGICDGRLTAGVVGTNKPHYDIWGDCVNLASRMDSCGEPGKIQVAESTEMVFRRNNISCTFNKYQDVKGKGMLNTYFLDLDMNGDIIRTTIFDEED